MSAGLDTLFSILLFAALLLLVRHALPEGSDSAGTDSAPDSAEAVERQARRAGGRSPLPPGDLDR